MMRSIEDTLEALEAIQINRNLDLNSAIQILIAARLLELTQAVYSIEIPK